MADKLADNSDKLSSFKENNEDERYRFFLESVLNELPIPTSVKDVTHNTSYLFWNKEAERMFSTSGEQLMGKSGYPFLSEESSDEMTNLNQEVVKTGQRFTGTVDTYITANNTHRLLAVNKSLVSYKDESKWLITSVQDITELQTQKDELQAQRDEMQEMNEKLDTAFRACQQMPWTWSVARRELRCDFSYDEIIGPFMTEYNNRGMCREEYLSFVVEEDRERLDISITEVSMGVRTKFREEFRLLKPTLPDGQPIWLETFGIVSKRDEQGRPIQVIGSFQQITKRKQMEQELRDARNKAEEANRLKSAFLANMSHEIRTPLNAIVGFSAILANVENPQEREDFMRIISNNNELLLQLIGDILDISKIEAGTLDFIYSDVDLNIALSELEASSRLRLRNDDVMIEFADRLPECFIHTDKNRLQQVLINFITNAIKFTKEGSIRFGYHLIDDNSKLRFFVTDTGCGISEDNLSRVFGRFVKLNTFAQGTGLGLSICEMIVRRMGGQIGVESTLEEGSTFWFTLPYQPVSSAAVEILDTQSVSLLEPVSLPDHDRIKILIAEDNESNYSLFEAILKDSYELIHAWNGQEAVDLFCSKQPHIVLTDIRMPVLDGFEVLSRLRQHTSLIPVIAVTAFSQGGDVEKIREAGFDDYISKPINSVLLQNAIITQIKRVYKTRN